MEQQWPVTRVGWLATRWPLTQPNPRWPTATLQLATRPVTSSSTPMCMFKINKYLNQKNSWSIDHVVFCRVKLWWCYTSFAFFFSLSQKWWFRVWWIHLPEGKWQTGDCCESCLDSRQQRHPLWNCCQIPVRLQCVNISKLQWSYASPPVCQQVSKECFNSSVKLCW